MKYSNKVIIVIAFALLNSVQCAPVTGSLYVRLPNMQAYEADGVEWNIKWWNGAEVQEKIVRIPYPPGGASREIRLDIHPQGIFVPVILAVPRMKLTFSSIPLSPFGALVTNPSEGVIELVRGEGEIARVVLRLATKGVEPAQINLERLRFSVAQRSRNWGERLRTLDEERLGSAIMRGAMRVSDISFKPTALHRIATPLEEVPKSGDVWFTDEPGSPVVRGQEADDESRFAIALAPGEVRRVWRRRSTGGWDILVVQRTPSGNSWHHRFTE